MYPIPKIHMKALPSSLLRRFSAAAAAIVALALASSASAAGTFNWLGAGANGGWPTAANWDGTITSDNQTDLVFNTTARTLAISGNGSYIGNAITVRSLSYGSGINAAIATSFNFFNAVTPVNLTLSSNIGNATITVDAGATGAISLGQAAGVGSNPGALVLSSNLDVVHNGSGQLTFNRAVTGTGALTKTGTGTLAFTGGTVANTYSGLTTVSGGGLTLGKTAGTDAIAGNMTVSGTGTVTLSLAGNQIKDSSNLEVATGGIFTMVGNSTTTTSETVNGVKLTGGSITSSGNASNTLTSTTAYDFQSGSASAILAGTAGANKTTAGTVTLSGVNTYTGVTTISAGTLSVGTIGNGGVAGNLGNATSAAANLVFDGGTLQYTGSNATSDRAFTINAGKTATIDTANNISFVGANGTATNGALTKTGAGTLTLTGNNTYTGNTTISAGTLSMASNLISSSANVFIGNGATLAASSGFSMTSGQSITGTGATGTINGNTNPGLTMNGNNTLSNNAGGQLSLLRLSVFGANNTITAGDIQSGASGAGTSRGLNIANGNAGTLTITGGSLTTTSNSSAVDILGSTNASGVGNLIINGGSFTSAAGLNIGFGAGSGALTLTSGNATISRLEFSAVNGNSDAVVNLNGGTFTLGNLTVTSGRANAVNFNGGTFKASANMTLGNGTVPVTFNVKNGGAIIDTNGNTVTISNALVNFGGNSTGGLTKQNAGTLILSGTNTYNGTTTVSAGTLLINGSTAAASAINVASGATLGGNGTINGATTINGALSPGNSPGLLTFGSSLTLNGTMNMEISGTSRGTTYDAVDVGGLLTYGGTMTLTIGSPITNGLYDLFGGAFSQTGNFTGIAFAGGAYSATWTFNGSLWTASTGSQDFSFDKITGDLTVAVPEPTTWALLAAGLTVVVIFRRRRCS